MYPYLGATPKAPTNRKSGRISLRTHKAYYNFIFSRTQAKIEEETKGNRLIVFMIGGATQYEVRCLYELSLKYKVELILGSTYFPSPSEFLQNILELNKPND